MSKGQDAGGDMSMMPVDELEAVQSLSYFLSVRTRAQPNIEIDIRVTNNIKSYLRQNSNIMHLYNMCE